jgi:hypothetical protein
MRDAVPDAVSPALVTAREWSSLVIAGHRWSYRRRRMDLEQPSSWSPLTRDGRSVWLATGLPSITISERQLGAVPELHRVRQQASRMAVQCQTSPCVWAGT